MEQFTLCVFVIALACSQVPKYSFTTAVMVPECIPGTVTHRGWLCRYGRGRSVGRGLGFQNLSSRFLFVTSKWLSGFGAMTALSSQAAAKVTANVESLLQSQN